MEKKSPVNDNEINEDYDELCLLNSIVRVFDFEAIPRMEHLSPRSIANYLWYVKYVKKHREIDVHNKRKGLAIA